VILPFPVIEASTVSGLYSDCIVGFQKYKILRVCQCNKNIVDCACFLFIFDCDRAEVGKNRQV
jgi:hypothetical protein